MGKGTHNSNPAAGDIALSQWILCVVWTGLLVGAADYAIGFGIFAAALGTPPIRILQHPASGVLGPAAYQGGIRTAALGIALHFAIALIWSVIYTAAYGALPALRRFTRTTAGLLAASVVAGVIVWLVMNSIVLPLSRTRPYPISSGLFWVLLAGHIPFVGLPPGAFAVSAVGHLCVRPLRRVRLLSDLEMI